MQRASLSSETIAALRKDYAAGVPLAQIATTHGCSQGTINYWVRGGPGKGPGRLPPLPPRKKQRLRKSATPAARREMVELLWRTACQQVREIDLRLKAGGQEPTERDRDTRMLAVLARTVRELVAFDARRSGSNKTSNETAVKDAAPDDKPFPADIDELRRELARRVDLIRQRRRLAGADGGNVAEGA